MRTLVPLLAVASLCAAPALAQPSAAPSPAAAPTVTLPPDAIGVREAVQAIAAQTGRRILIEPGVVGTIGINLNAVPLEAALSSVTKGTGNTWSRLTLSPEQAKSLTSQAAANLARAADSLAASVISIRTANGRDVAVSPTPSRASNTPAAPPAAPRASANAAPTKDATLEVVYVVRTDTISADAATQQELKDAEVRGTNLKLAEDAKSDPAVVNAYSTLKSLSPDQMALVTREFITHITPDEAKVLQQSFEKQREQMKGMAPPH